MRFISFLIAFFILIVFCKLNGQNINYYFGNIHSHTGYSDGSKDSSSTGVSRPDQAYAYAKVSQHFDFLGISEHNHNSSGNPGFKLPSYAKGLSMADSALTPSFLSLFGVEYGVSSTYNGHVLIYGFDKLIGWETGNYDIYNGKTDYDGLFRRIKNNPQAFACLAHPDVTDYSTAGNASGSIGNGPYNSMYDSAIVGVPLRSGPAFSSYNTYIDYANGNYFSYFTKLLSKGYHLGIGYDHDNHYTNFGRSNAGRLVILAPSLSKNDFFKAMKQRNFYGSDDWNAQVDFRLEGNIMGSITTGTNMPYITVNHNDLDGEQAAIIKVWRGISGTNVLPVVVYSSQGNSLNFTDSELQAGAQYYYFIEIIQNDSQWIVTSPIWYTYGQTTMLNQYDKSPSIKVYPVPADDYINISTGIAGSVSVQLIALNGNSTRSYFEPSGNMQLCVAELPAGFYTLIIKTSQTISHKRIIISH